ncbi:MAG: GNAT family N-acetyltransferase [Candidatus Velthaea sp.]
MDTRPLTLRLARPDDLPAIVDIFNAAIATRVAVAYLEPVSADDRRGWFAEHGMQAHPIHVACLGERVTGWLSVSPYAERPAYDATAEVSVYVAPHMQRAGIASALLQHAEAAAAAAGITTFIARIFGSNAKSVAYFERNGYARWGRLPQIGIVDGEARDVLIYGKRLR